MKKTEKDSVRKLIDLMKNMYKIIASNAYNDVGYGKKTVTGIVGYLEEALENDTVEYEELVKVVMEQYKSMFSPKCGLSEFHIWHNDYNIRFKANKEYEEIKEQIEEILSTSK